MALISFSHFIHRHRCHLVICNGYDGRGNWRQGLVLRSLFCDRWSFLILIKNSFHWKEKLHKCRNFLSFHSVRLVIFIIFSHRRRFSHLPDETKKNNVQETIKYCKKKTKEINRYLHVRCKVSICFNMWPAHRLWRAQWTHQRCCTSNSRIIVKAVVVVVLML